MIRLACLLGIVALVLLILLVVDLNGWTAIYWVFIGFPALVLALGVYILYEWRRGALRIRDGNASS